MVPVSELKIGMQVCEMDRPWLELPFEPPFQIQGFRISSLDEIEKIRHYCSHVYIDLDSSPPLEKPRNHKRWPLSRFIPSIVLDALASIAGGNRRADHAENGSKRPASHRSKLRKTSIHSLDRRSISDIDRIFAATERVLPRRYQVLSPKNPSRVVYQDQTTFEEEIEPATDALDDATAFYEDLTHEISNDKQVDVESLNDRVDAMARSIIRNPDALSYLIHLKSFNKHTYDLAISSCVMTMTFGRFLGLEDGEIRTLGTGALLHDIGMIRLPRAMLEKPAQLSETEHQLVKRHARLSSEIVAGINGIEQEARDICLYHHERMDGSGYPEGLRGDQIPLMAMVTGIVDTYMALVSYRPYRNTSTSFQALCELSALKHTKFLGALVDRFVRHIAIFPVGSFVKLNSGHVAVVVGRNPMRILEPKVMLVLDPAGNKMEKSLTINFAAERKSRYLEGIRIVGEIVPDKSDISLAEFFT